MPISKELLEQIEKDKYEDEFLYLGDQDFNDEDIDSLCEALKKNGKIRKIDFRGKEISEKAISAITSLSNIKGLIMMGTGITGSHIKILSSSSLEELDISSNTIDAEGILDLSKNKSIKILKATNCDISSKSLADFIKNNSTIEDLDFSDNELDDDCLNTIHLNTSLKSLTLKGCGLTSKCSKLLAENKSIESINLSYNPIKTDGLMVLSKNSTLRCITIMRGEIDNIGFLGKNESLKKLSFPFNSINSEGISGLEKNKTLTYLYLSNNRLDDNCMKYFSVMKSLENLNLEHNRITIKSKSFLKDMYGFIKNINLNNNPIGYCSSDFLPSFSSKRKRKDIVDSEKVEKDELTVDSEIITLRNEI
jgi:Leucine Rich repeat